MADLNHYTSRTLASKAGISSKLASEIVGLRKEKGCIQSFSELWNADGMNRPIMKKLTSNFVIRNVPLPNSPETSNKSNNNNRIFGKKKKRKNSGKQNSKQKPVVNKQNIAKMNSRFLESLPLLVDDETAETSKDESLMTIYTPMAIQPTPSRDKIFTVYQVASPDKIRPLKHGGKPLPSKNRSDNHPDVSAQMNTTRKIFNMITRSRRSKFEQKLSPTKKRSIQRWLENTNTESSRSVLSNSNTYSRSRSRYRRKDRSKSREGSWSRSRSSSPLLRNSTKNKNWDSQSKSTIRAGKANSRHRGHGKSNHFLADKNSLIRQKLRGKKTGYISHKPSGKKVPANAPVTVLDIESSNGSEEDRASIKYSDRRYVEETASRSRSGSVEPVNAFAKDTDSAEKQKCGLTNLSRDSVRHGIARRSLWKNSKRRPHRSFRKHRHGRSRDRIRSHDRKHNQNSKESCVIL